MKKIIFVFLISILIFSNCYKDKFSEIYPGAGLFTPCDTTSHPSYSQHIAPLLENYCIGCHSGPTTSGTADFSTYAGVLPWTADGASSKIVGCSWHLVGYNPMPPSFQLDSCQMRQIYLWVIDGAPNN